MRFDQGLPVLARLCHNASCLRRPPRSWRTMASLHVAFLAPCWTPFEPFWVSKSAPKAKHVRQRCRTSTENESRSPSLFSRSAAAIIGVSTRDRGVPEAAPAPSEAVAPVSGPAERHPRSPIPLRRPLKLTKPSVNTSKYHGSSWLRCVSDAPQRHLAAQSGDLLALPTDVAALTPLCVSKLGFQLSDPEMSTQSTENGPEELKIHP